MVLYTFLFVCYDDDIDVQCSPDRSIDELTCQLLSPRVMVTCASLVYSIKYSGYVQRRQTHLECPVYVYYYTYYIIIIYLLKIRLPDDWPATVRVQ